MLHVVNTFQVTPHLPLNRQIPKQITKGNYNALISKGVFTQLSAEWHSALHYLKTHLRTSAHNSVN